MERNCKETGKNLVRNYKEAVKKQGRNCEIYLNELGTLNERECGTCRKLKEIAPTNTCVWCLTKHFTFVLLLVGTNV